MSRVITQISRALHGVGIHSGKNVSIKLMPLNGKHNKGGVVLKHKDQQLIPALAKHVQQTDFQTVVGPFATVEHVLAALWGMNVRDGVIEVDSIIEGRGPSFLDNKTTIEFPIMDGSSQEFVEWIEQASSSSATEEVDSRPLLILKHPIHVESQDGKSFVDVLPQPANKMAFSVEVKVDFNGHHESFEFERDWNDVDKSIDVFKREIAPARTFAFEHEIPFLHAKNLGLGGNAHNCVIFSSQAVNEPVNTKLRFPNERARHKMLDVLGDFALVGPYRLVAKVVANRPGHGINHRTVCALLDQL